MPETQMVDTSGRMDAVMAGSEVANKCLCSVSRHLCAEPSKFGKFRWESKKMKSGNWVVPSVGTPGATLSRT